MTEIHDTPTSATHPAPVPASPDAPAPQRPVRSPSGRATAVLAGVMLAIGVAVGAAIGPAPDSSLAGASRVPLLLPALTALAGSGGHSSAVKPPPASAQATPAPATTSSAGSAASATPTSSSATSPSSSSAPQESKPAPTPAAKPQAALPPVTNVWLVELSGTSFAGALAQPAAAPYIAGQAVPAGALLSSWSAIDGSAFASEAALLAGTPPQLVHTIVQPPCPEGAAGAQCAAGTPGELTAADEFLKATVPTITQSVAYRTKGLIVVTFATIASASAAELPTGAASATLTSEPPAGVLLISPFASAGSRPTTSFNPTSPRKSLEKLLQQ
jgi:hypothetical protein